VNDAVDGGAGGVRRVRPGRPSTRARLVRPSPEGASEAERKIRALLETEIRPAVAMDGGRHHALPLRGRRGVHAHAGLRAPGARRRRPRSSRASSPGSGRSSRTLVEVGAGLSGAPPPGEGGAGPPRAPPRAVPAAPPRAPPAHPRGAPQRGRAPQAQAGEPPGGPASAPRWTRCSRAYPEPVLVDAGSGQRVPGFILYELFLKPEGAGDAAVGGSRGRTSPPGARERGGAAGLRPDAVLHRGHLGGRVPGAGAPPHRAARLRHRDRRRAGRPPSATARTTWRWWPCCQAEVAQQLKGGGGGRRPGRCGCSSATRGTGASSARTSPTSIRAPGAGGVRLPR